MSSKSKTRYLNTWRGKTITLMGFGLFGGGTEDAIFFIKNGVKKLIITDLKTKKELESSVRKVNQFLSTIEQSDRPMVEWVLGKHREKDFINTDLIIKNPGIPNNSIYLQIAKGHNVNVDTSIGIFFKLMNPKKLIGITGTKGKSTVSSLIYEIIKNKYSNSYITGTPGTSPLSFVDKKGWGVLELSSWRLEGVDRYKKSPHIAVITNIEQDHLNMHKSFEEYKKAKKIIFKYQNKDDYLILNKKLKTLAKRTFSKVHYFSGTRGSDTPAIGEVYAENVNAVLQVAKVLNINKREAINIIKKFKGLHDRMELVSTINKTKIYNDTTATNPFATLRALDRFKNKKVGLIIGGEDKNLDYTKLSNALKKLHFVTLLPGSASDKIYNTYNLKLTASVRSSLTGGRRRKTYNKKLTQVKTLHQALAKSIDSNPEVILFSPAAASFNMFKNEFDRGQKFKETVFEYKNSL